MSYTVESFGVVGQRVKVAASFVLPKWIGRPVKVWDIGECFLNSHSLGPVAMRWFDSLKASSIDSFKELTRAFGSCFVTCRRVPRPLASLLSLSMREGETL